MEVKNMVILPAGHFAPRNKKTLAILHKFVRHHFPGKNMYDKRTRAYKWMLQHDSEFKANQ